jgi:hypothetical protein
VAMTLVLETDGGASEFLLKPIDRMAGRSTTKKLAVDSQGRQCRRGLMTHDGLLLSSGTVTDLYEDGDGNTVEHTEVVQTDECGNTLRNLPATVGRPQRPAGPVPVDELLEHTVAKAYMLVPLHIARDLSDLLAAGDIYRVVFRPRASVVDRPAFILANGSGIFLIQCKVCLFEFIRLDQYVVVEDEMDDEDDLWDDWRENSHADLTGGETW